MAQQDAKRKRRILENLIPSLAEEQDMFIKSIPKEQSRAQLS